MKHGKLSLQIILVLILAACSSVTPTIEEQPTLSQVISPQPTIQEEIQICPPYYGEPEKVLTLQRPTDLHHLVNADFNDDSYPDILLARANWQTSEEYEIEILINDKNGKFILGTSEIFLGEVPSVTDVREVVIADFNGDNRPDIFLADQGMDDYPQPGYQNTLVLSAPDGKMIDATNNLPQQDDFTHSAAATDIDGDGDIDLYIGNIWGEKYIQPSILINTDGKGSFSKAKGRLPYPLEDYDFGAYTTCEFVDVNNDSFPDLILGDFGDELEGGPDSYVLVNDGKGYFSILPDAIPAKPFANNDQVLDIQAADINSDGFQDLFLVFTPVDYSGNYIQILINKQDGTFLDETSERLPQGKNRSSWIKFITLIDLNKDNTLDISAFSVGSKEPLFYLNNGDGTFHSIKNIFNIGIDRLFTFADMNKNGYLDAIWSDGGCQHGSCPENYFVVYSLDCQSLD